MKMNIMKKGFLTFGIMALLTMLILPTNLVEAQEVSHKREYTNNQISNEKLIRMAYDGQFVNNYHTKTKFTDGDISIAEVKKVLSEDLVDGKVVKKKMMCVKSIEIKGKALDEARTNKLSENMLTSEEGNLVVLEPGVESITASFTPGSKSRTYANPSASVQMTVVNYYDIYESGIVEYYRMTKATFKPSLLDTSFRLTALNSNMGYAGAGLVYNSSTGTFSSTAYKTVETTYSKAYPVSGTTYTKNTGFTFFRNSGSGGGGVNSSLTFERNTTGTVYIYTLPQVSF